MPTCHREGCPKPTKGPRARFCSGACKQAHFRKRDIAPLSVTLDVTASPSSVTLKGLPAHDALRDRSDVPTIKFIPHLTNTGSMKRPGHADGCPCWVCSGVPSKKKPKPKKT